MSSAFSSLLAYLVAFLGLAEYSQGITNLADVECGHQAINPNPKLKAARIAGGIEAFRGEFPWMVSLHAFGQSHFCGGFLINNRYAVSAAHCLENFTRDSVSVLIGEHEIGVEENPENSYAVDVEKIILHPFFRKGGKFRNDIALIRLKKQIKWSTYVQPACLPNPKDKIIDGQLTSVAGWGHSKETSPVVSSTLLTVEIPIVSNSVCQDNYEWTPTANNLCAGVVGGGKGACQGDSGSPLMMRTKADDSLAVVGIHVGGGGCGEHMLPGIYTRVSSYVDWIKLNIRK